ncbi:hypothetical protein [Trichothermofontia sp.]
MYDPEDILEAARTIRPYLGELLETEIADPIDTQLAELLTQSDTQTAIANNVLELLSAQDTTREWAFNFLQNQQQPEHLRAWSPLPGDMSIVNAAKYSCPHGDYVWYQPRVGIEPPACPTHKCFLNRAS